LSGVNRVQDEKGRRYRSRETEWIGLLSFGFFVLALGFIWIITPNLSNEIVNFGKDFTQHSVNITDNVRLPAPVNNHPVLYTAIMQLAVALAIFQIGVLALRFIYHDSIRRKASTISSIAFWFAAAFFLNMLAIATNYTTSSWFAFVAGLIICVGLAIIVSHIVRLFR
jgi:hypothetical protein